MVWPSLIYGYYPAFHDFPGSITLSRTTFIRLVGEVVAEIERWNPRRLYILDTGISTIEQIGEALASMSSKNTVHLKIHDGPRYTAVAKRIAEQKFGSHADEQGTAHMLVIAPALVNMAQAEATPAGPIEGPLTRLNAPSGAYGDPRLTTHAKGQALLDAMMADLVAACVREESGPAPIRSD